MKTGRIIKIISNQYTIQAEDGQYLAHPRGKLRLSTAPVVGDLVHFEERDGSVVIDSILPRSNRLLRPSVANVDQALIVTSCKDPDFSEHLLDRLIFLVRLAGIQPVLVITKKDMLSQEQWEALEKKLAWYEKGGYTLVYTHPGSDDAGLQAILKDKISVLCGQSGAGKSSLLNRLDPTFQLQTQQISKALGRGKHTTRHCELHPVAGGLVADTPGFSSLDFSRLDTDCLDVVIPDFEPYLGSCRYADCRHLKEPGCAVKAALEAGELNPYMYEDYVQIKEEAQNPRYKKKPF